MQHVSARAPVYPNLVHGCTTTAQACDIARANARRGRQARNHRDLPTGLDTYLSLVDGTGRDVRFAGRVEGRFRPNSHRSWSDGI